MLYAMKTKLVRVIDGDTVVLDLDLGLRIHSIQPIRLHGIDAPELHGVTDPAPGLAAKAFLEAELAKGPLRVLITTEDKYGRWLGIIWWGSGNTTEMRLSVNQAMITAGYAKPYSGGKR